MNTTKNTLKKHLPLPLKAFTLLESLLVLFISSFLLIGFSNSVTHTIESTQEALFFLSFEQLYKDSQQLAVTSHQAVALTLQPHTISNGQQTIAIPATISLAEENTISFNKNGGNSSLANITFHTAHDTVRYQLYLGSGRYKKTHQ